VLLLLAKYLKLSGTYICGEVQLTALLEIQTLNHNITPDQTSREPSARLYNMQNIPPAIVLDWTRDSVYILCPFHSCEVKVHRHGYPTSNENCVFVNYDHKVQGLACCSPTDDKSTRRTPNLNRCAHCIPFKNLQYRLIFPYQNNLLVKNFGFILDRQKGEWKTVADELVDPRKEKEEGELCVELTRTSISQETIDCSLETEEGAWFLSYCVTDNLLECERTLKDSQHPKILVEGRSSSDGKTALACACIEGHLQIVKFLREHGADVESADNSGCTPLMLAVTHGRGQIAFYLAQHGASLFAMDHDSTTVIYMARTTLGRLNEMDRITALNPIYGSEYGSASMEEINKKNESLRANKERMNGLENLIDLYMALKPERDLQLRVVDQTNSGGFSIFQTNGTLAPRVSLNKTLFATKMADYKKRFAFLDRGRPFENVHATAVSGYTPGPFGTEDGCLNRRTWTRRVFQYCEVVGHELKRAGQYDRSVPGSYNACHAEKQLMAYFLWMHTTVDRDFTGSYKDEKYSPEIWGKCEEIVDLEACKPDVNVLKKDIYISREPCSDCKLFQQKTFEKTGIFFNLSYVNVVIHRVVHDTESCTFPWH
jgi:hypothetical protein